MADKVACLTQGEVQLLRRGHATERLESPYQEQVNARAGGKQNARIVSVTRGRVGAELCYAISTGAASGVFAQVPGSRQEQRLFHGSDAHLSDIDFSFADEALACAVAGRRGTSALGVLADDGKGVRTVTEGDVVDRAPRWAPGGRAEIVYASAGIGRTKSGAWAGLAPYSLYRLRLADNSVEVLMADAKYDYSAPVPIAEGLLYALRRAYEPGNAPSVTRLVLAAFFPGFRENPPEPPRSAQKYELVRLTPGGSEVVQRDVVAFDLAPNGDIVYSDGASVSRIPANHSGEREQLAALAQVEQLVVY